MSRRLWSPAAGNPYVGDDPSFEADLAAPDQPDVPSAVHPDATEVARPDATRLTRPDATEVVRPDTTRTVRPDATHMAQPDATAVSHQGRTSVVPNGDARAGHGPSTPSDPGATQVRPQGSPRFVSAKTGRGVAVESQEPVDATAVHSRRVSTAPVRDAAFVSSAEAARAALDGRGTGPDDAYFGGAASRGPRVPEPVARAWSRGLKAPVDRRRLRFWRWFRTIPIMVMVLMGIAAVVLSWLPGTTLRHWLYPVHYAEAITASAERHGVDPDLVCAVIKTESNWQPTAQSQAGAQGLMQLMPSTAQDLAARGYVDGSRYPADDLTDPTVNIEYGSAYLAYLVGATGSVDEAIAAYNAGPGKAADWREVAQEVAGGDISAVIDYPETRAYLARVTSALDEYQTLYPDGLVDD